MLTKKQKDLLLFIHHRMAEGDIAPSFDEMRDALKLKSKSGIHRLITGLVERGYLARLPHRARALEVKKLPEGYLPSGQDASRVATQAREIGALIAQTAMTALQAIPLRGKIAAGSPIEAVRDDTAMIDIPPTLIGTGDHYALTVEGDSMINIGIHDGDTVIIKSTQTAQDGAVVVALIDGAEVTLKRLKRDRGNIILIAENESYAPRVLEPRRVQIQGQLVSLIRRYH